MVNAVSYMKAGIARVNQLHGDEKGWEKPSQFYSLIV
jgi:hypothetical protein